MTVRENFFAAGGEEFVGDLLGKIVGLAGRAGEPTADKILALQV